MFSTRHLIGILAGIALAIIGVFALYGNQLVTAAIPHVSGNLTAEVLKSLPSYDQQAPVSGATTAQEYSSVPSSAATLNTVKREEVLLKTESQGTIVVPNVVTQPRTTSVDTQSFISTERPFVPNLATTTVPDRVEGKINQLTGVITTYEVTNTAVDVTKERLTNIVDQTASQARITVDPPDVQEKNAAIQSAQDDLKMRINTWLNTPVMITPTSVEKLKGEVNAGLSEIRQAAPGTSPDGSIESAVALRVLIETIATSSAAFKEKGGDLLFKDSNGDGISDYESIHIYNLDPQKPSPVSEYQGRTITAGEKIALGFDPTRANLRNVYPEDPATVTIPEAKAYTVNTVALTESKKVTFEGRALPNSFITLFINSTPIVVTIKTDENGDWKYTLDKELEDGSHTISTATVDNSGRILAKSSPYPFTKTAQAATLDTAPPVPGATTTEQPSLLTLTNIYLLLGILFGLFLLTLMIIGLRARKESANTLVTETPTTTV